MKCLQIHLLSAEPTYVYAITLKANYDQSWRNTMPLYQSAGMHIGIMRIARGSHSMNMVFNTSIFECHHLPSLSPGTAVGPIDHVAEFTIYLSLSVTAQWRDTV